MNYQGPNKNDHKQYYLAYGLFFIILLYHTEAIN